MQSIIRCLLAFSPFYLSSSLSGPWPEAFIRATTQSSGITNILSRSGERKVRLLLTVWMITQSHQKSRSWRWQPWGHNIQHSHCGVDPVFASIHSIWFYWFYLRAKRWSGSWTAFPCRLHNSVPQKLCFTEPRLSISSVSTITVAANEQGKYEGLWLLAI